MKDMITSGINILGWVGIWVAVAFVPLFFYSVYRAKQKRKARKEPEDGNEY